LALEQLFVLALASALVVSLLQRKTCIVSSAQDGLADNTATNRLNARNE
jgi:hypothetical protein